MFTFLNSSILIGLAAVALPLLIHLLTRQKVRTVFFSSLEFLRELKNQQIRRLKIRQILLLIIRTVIILMILLAFARPALKGKISSGVGAGAKTSAVIILDNTYSMGREVEGQRLFDLAKEKALEVADLLRSGDEMLLLYPQNPPALAFEGPRYSQEVIKQAIKTSTLSYRSTNYLTSLQQAQQLLSQSKNVNREIYLISDFQESGLKKDSPSVSGLLNPDVRLYLVPLQYQVENNLGIEKIRLANQILETGKVCELEAIIKNYGETAERNRLVQLFIEGKRSGQTAVNLQPGEARKLNFKFVPEETGLLSGSVLLEDDHLSQDNHRFFTFSIPSEIKVLLVGHTVQDMRYLGLALNPSEQGSSTITAEKISWEKLNPWKLTEYQVVILSNVPRLEAEMIADLQDYVSRGRGLLIFLGSDVDLRYYNDTFNRKFNLPLFTEPAGKLGVQSSFLSFGKIDFSHPLFQGIFETDEKSIDSPHFFFVLKTTPAANSESIIEYNNGTPFLIETKLGKGRVLLFTTALDENWGDLPWKGIFVPLINRSVAYLAGTSDQREQEVLIGGNITYTYSEAEVISDLEMERPDGDRIKVKPEVSRETYIINFSETELPGIYKLYARERMLGKWAVNPDPDESLAKGIDLKQFTERIGNGQVFVINKGESIENFVLRARYGRELWKYFVTVCLILLIVEMLLYKERGEAGVDTVKNK